MKEQACCCLLPLSLALPLIGIVLARRLRARDEREPNLYIVKPPPEEPRDSEGA